MISVRGIYNGKTIKPLTKIDKKPNTPVIITFLDEEITFLFDEVKKNINKKPKSLILVRCRMKIIAKKLCRIICPDFPEFDWGINNALTARRNLSGSTI